jgi:murein DD-endopeptidase MepM/ murein hydrolase activator NlpD
MALILLAALALATRKSSTSSGGVATAHREGGGWCEPLPALFIAGLRYNPTVSDTYSATKTAGHRRHLGVDVMYKRRAKKDLPQYTGRESSGNRWYFFPQGIPVHCARDGVVWALVNDPERGLGVQVVHDKGTVMTWYQHLASVAQPWKRGDKVQRGDILGVQGYSPNGDAPIHLHFGLRYWNRGERRWQWVDPEPELKRWPVAFTFTV